MSSREKPTLILASTSPRRRELLAQIGIPFVVIPVEIDETPHPDEPPADYVLRMATAKALAGRASAGASEARLLLAADTTVSYQGKIFGKPADAPAAHAMLRALSATQHEVLTAIAVCNGTATFTALSVTQVWFRALDDAEIAAYVASGEPMDKAGGYGLQGLGATLVAHISGSFSGVVGLPLTETALLLRGAGYPI